MSGRRATPLTARPLGPEYYDSPLLVARISSFRASNSISTAHLVNARHVICAVENEINHDEISFEKEDTL
jgi:hypothetical protein